MFVDASAIIAILTREDDADELIDRLQEAQHPISSAIAIFQATLGLSYPALAVHAPPESASQASHATVKTRA